MARPVRQGAARTPKRESRGWTRGGFRPAVAGMFPVGCRFVAPPVGSRQEPSVARSARRTRASVVSACPRTAASMRSASAAR
jgi:hypothetical protein